MAVATQYPTTNGAHGALGQLTNPTYAYTDDGTNFATGAPGKNTSLANAYGTFGFDAIIASTATITKVQIIYEYQASTTSSIASTTVHSLVSGAAQADHNNTAEPASMTAYTYDITADRVWTRANLLDGVLTVALEAIRGNSSTAVTFSYDFIKVEVTYSTSVNTPQTVTGALAITGTIARAIGKFPTGSFVSTGIVTKQSVFNRTVAGALALIAGIQKGISKKVGV